MRFPDLSAVDIDGRMLTVPDGLPRGPRAVVLAFEMAQRQEAARWLETLAATKRADLSVWQLIALSDGFREMRTYIENGKRRAIEDPERRKHTLVAYTDLGALAEKLALPTLSSCYAFLLDSRGLVYWRARCPIDEAVVGLFRGTLAQL